MDVTVTTLRSHLSEWIDRARSGEQIIVTDRGLPVARLSGLDSTPLIERLTAEGVLGRPARPNRLRSTDWVHVEADESISDIVSEQRR